MLLESRRHTRSAIRVGQASQTAEKVIYFFIPSEARNLSSIEAQEKKERFLASLGMTKNVGTFSASFSTCLPFRANEI
jgi:hypothetical protein